MYARVSAGFSRLDLETNHGDPGRLKIIAAGFLTISVGFLIVWAFWLI
jgi:hypothetical protein